MATLLPTTFVLRVARAGVEVRAQATVQAGYRNRIRVLADAPFAQTNASARLLEVLLRGAAASLPGMRMDFPIPRCPNALLEVDECGKAVR